MKSRNIVAAGSYIATFVTAVAGMHWNHLVAPLADRRPGTWLMFIAGIAAAALSKALAEEPSPRAVAMTGMAMAAGVLLDAVLHFFIPPETGNLWPMSVLAIGVMGSFAAVIGIGVGGASIWLRKHFRSGSGT